MNVPDGALERVVPAVAGVVISVPWVWVAVRTTSSLRSLTSRKVPFPKRTIWIAKILALIVGAGGVMGAMVELGFSWYFAAFPAGAVVFFALRERVEEIVIPKPPPTEASFLPAWEGYRRLWKKVVWAYGEMGILFGVAVLAIVLGQSLPETVQRGIAIVVGLVFILSMTNLYLRLWKFRYWPCPRCGSSFRGLWDRPWLPKRCRYCGLECWNENPEHRP